MINKMFNKMFKCGTCGLMGADGNAILNRVCCDIYQEDWEKDFIEEAMKMKFTKKQVAWIVSMLRDMRKRINQ